MGVQDRLFAWDLFDLGLFRDPGKAKFDPLSTVRQVGGLDLLSLFKNCRFRIQEETREGRATSEIWSYPLLIASDWSASLGAVVDPSFPSLMSIRLLYGPGPYILYARNDPADVAHLTQAIGRGILSEVEWSMDMGEQSQSLGIKGRGPLTFGHTI